MIRISGFCLALLLLVCAARPVRAQEVQVPMDRDGRITLIGRPLAARLGLFTGEYEGFREARLFQAPDSSYVLEITTVAGGTVARRRVPMTAAQVAELRERVSALVAVRDPGLALNQEGRSLLLAQATVAGLAFYGPAIPYAAHVHGYQGQTGAYLLTAGAGFLIPYALTQHQPVSYAMANMTGYGITRGAAHGALLHAVLAGAGPEADGISDPTFQDSGDRDRARAAVAVGASVAEGFAGYYWARDARMTPGVARAIGTGGDFGFAEGLGVAYLVHGDRGENVEERLVSGLALAGSAAGIVVGNHVARHRDYTWGDANVIYTGGAVGLLAGGALAYDTDMPDRPAVALGMATALSGLYLGDRMVRRTDFSVGQASVNALGTIAGGLVGLGVGVIAGDVKTGAATTAVGAAAGYFGTYHALKGEAMTRQTEALSGWHVHVEPSGLAVLARGKDSRTPMPLLTVQHSF
ncbi:MAG TPA: hypothetical protein VFE05_00145 [Longimicrobiaceae bacterium]|jgi:hypothetical protein|nr:hypothetical protein [Longimicrobiaceae bacterium]